MTDLEGTLYPDLLMTEASQEHGILSQREGSTVGLPEISLGSKVRILPNHACATAAQHDRYYVLQPGTTAIRAVWPRIQGW